MAASIYRRRGHFPSFPFLAHLQSVLWEPKRWAQTLVVGDGASVSRDFYFEAPQKQGASFSSTRRTVDSRVAGIRKSDISNHVWVVLKILRKEGFDAYLVGGCVRDLLLKKMPKDFDVVTNATLRQVKKCFYKSRTVGRRYPICHVHIGGFITEVSSFATTITGIKKREENLSLQPRDSCDQKDLARWRNCMVRDFTINSLFYDPDKDIIYDYVSGLRDIKKCKVRTIIPAHLSFEEDPARILRGVRVAARLGMQFSKKTDAALCDLSSSIIFLNEMRIMMELNFMLAYGSAVASICLLQKFNILKLLLPIQAAYLADQTKKQPDGKSNMLIKFFASLDKLLAVDHPSDCLLWMALLSFHVALLDHPQCAVVVLTIASILYYGSWSSAAQFVRKNAQLTTHFAPEFSESSSATMSDESLLVEASHLASLVRTAVQVFGHPDALKEFMERHSYPQQCQEVAFVSKKLKADVGLLFKELENDIRSYNKERKTCDIDCRLLKANNLDETRFVLGRIIIDAMIDGGVHEASQFESSRGDRHQGAENQIELPHQDDSAAPVKERACPQLSHLFRY